MKRRNFFAGSLGLAATALTETAVGQSNKVHSVLRTSRLFEPLTPPGGRDLIQDVIATNNTIISLHGDTKAGRWSVTAVTPNGSMLWSVPLKKGFYAGLGTSNSGSAVIIHAFSYAGDGKAKRNCVLRLRPDTGSSIELMGSADSTGSTARMFFAGDSFLVRLAKSSLEIWSVGTDVRLETTSDILPNVLVHVNAISENTIALTALDGTTMSAISIPTGVRQDHPISDPNISQARIALQKVLASAGSSDPQVDRVPPTIIAITGANREQRVVHALISPVPVGQATPLIAIDATGSVSSVGSYDVNYHLGPVKLVEQTGEIGIVYGDGSVTWYALEG